MNILDRIHDDYEEYDEICRLLGEMPVAVDGGFYSHLVAILERHNFNSTEQFYKQQNEQNKEKSAGSREPN